MSKGKLFADHLYSERGRFAAFTIFIFVVFFMGGGSRDDIESLVILRPVAVLFCAYALTGINKDQLKRLGLPFALLVLLMMLMLAQLVPLPFSVWSQLPQREIYIEIAKVAEMGEFSRPLSLSPSKTWNSLFSLFVPLAAMLLFAIQSAKYQRAIIFVLMGAGLVSAAFGFLQVVGPDDSIFFLYKVTNVGQPVGLFANQNHHALVLVCTLVMLGWFMSRLPFDDPSTKWKLLLSILSLMALIPLIFVAGSRAGLLLGAAALVTVFYLFSRSIAVASTPLGGLHRIGSKGIHKVIWAVGAMGSIFMIALAVVFSRSAALDQLVSQSPLEGLRAKLLPVLIDMSWAYFPFGSGFGSFERVYPQFEKMELLNPRYLNQAHNDWLQIVIEGGLPATILVLVLLIWLARKTALVVKNRARNSHAREVMALFIILACIVASLVDYPMRVPSVMLLFSVSCAILAAGRRKKSGARSVKA
ncbi:O-antigen ligase family protein [Parasphingorhabdus sp.]|uniref:O-antigen ligase family protein n=1 Tax=Parasphingorhabdus sp. TaxID=2709688 RepID=UPI003A95AE93